MEIWMPMEVKTSIKYRPTLKFIILKRFLFPWAINNLLIQTSIFIEH